MIDVQRRFSGPGRHRLGQPPRPQMQPYRLLLVHGAENLSDDQLLKLIRVLQKGARCGVFCLATVNSAPLSAGRAGRRPLYPAAAHLDGSQIMLATCGQGRLALTCNGVRFQPTINLDAETCRGFARAYRRLAEGCRAAPRPGRAAAPA